jgi:hypothetical protein
MQLHCKVVALSRILSALVAMNCYAIFSHASCHSGFEASDRQVMPARLAKFSSALDSTMVYIGPGHYVLILNPVRNAYCLDIPREAQSGTTRCGYRLVICYQTKHM